MVVAKGYAVVGCELPVALAENGVLILGAVPAIRQWRQALNRCLRGWVGGQELGQVQEHDVLNGIPLSVIVEKKESLVLHNWTAGTAAKLVEVIWGSRPGWNGNLVDHIIGIERFVTVEPETRSVQLVGPGFRDHVDNGAARPAELCGVSIRIDLKLLDGILAELKGRSPGTGAPGRLTEEGVVIISAVDNEAIHCSALTGEADVAGAHIASHARRE